MFRILDWQKSNFHELHENNHDCTTILTHCVKDRFKLQSSAYVDLGSHQSLHIIEAHVFLIILLAVITAAIFRRVHYCLSLFVIVRYCSLLFVTVRYCSLLFVTVRFCSFLFVSVRSSSKVFFFLFQNFHSMLRCRTILSLFVFVVVFPVPNYIVHVCISTTTLFY